MFYNPSSPRRETIFSVNKVIPAMDGVISSKQLLSRWRIISQLRVGSKINYKVIYSIINENIVGNTLYNRDNAFNGSDSRFTKIRDPLSATR